MRTSIFITLLAAVLLSGCASFHDTTPKFVEKFAEIDSKLAALEAKHDADIKAVEDKHSADVANLEKADSEALNRANAAYKLAEGKFVFTTVLSDGSVKFASGRAEISKDAQAKLVDLARQLQGDNKDVYLEIQGYTDSVGSKASKEALGLKRAEAVRLFLNQQGVALNRMSTVSYGDSFPVESNKTAAGRAANRRVVIITVK